MPPHRGLTTGSDEVRQMVSNAKTVLRHTRAAKGTPEARTWNIWCKMRQRCQNVNCIDYPRYGARGIVVCPEWEVYANFVQNMGLVPEGMTLERKNNSLGYSPSNCCWIPKAEQARNRRNNHVLTINEVSKTLAEWAEISGLRSSTIRARIKYNGGVVDESILAPVGGYRHS
jgi:hypothetical protein